MASTQKMQGASKLTPDAVKKLTEKLNEMLGEDNTTAPEQLINERGEPLNEEGLPIIEITEPITATSEEDTGDALIPEDVLPPPVSSLTPEERDRLRRERDRILNLLEQEENFERQGRRLSFEEKQEILRKRKEAAASEKEKLQAAKLTQKRMGKALLRSMSEGKSPVDDAATADTGKSSKKVTFADDVEDNDSERPSSPPHAIADWGDLAPGRLRFTGQPSLLSSYEKLPMKMAVVERKPHAPLKTVPVREVDSDDESDPESLDGDDQEADNSESEQLMEDDEYDFDTVQHQREVALEYYEKRKEIGAAAKAAVSAQTENGSENVSSEMTSISPKKPALSQFKASRLASSYNIATASQALPSDTVVTNAASRVLQKSIRTGKLDANGQLVGGDTDSANEGENDEGTQQMMKLLREGEVYNVGPDGKFLNTISPPTGSGQLSAAHTVPGTKSNLPYKDLPIRDKPKTSRFKLSRANAGRPSDAVPSSHTPSLEPKARANQVVHMPRSVTALNERGTVLSTSNLPPVIGDVSQGYSASAATASGLPFSSMIVESPSFPHPAVATASRVGSMSIATDPVHPQRTSRPLRPPVVVSAVKESAPSAPTSNWTQHTKSGKVSRFMTERR